MDGRLEAREEGYFVRAREGVSRPVYEVPDALAQFVGRRVFVAHEAGFALRFGLLEAGGVSPRPGTRSRLGAPASGRDYARARSLSAA
jgi:hypothetical protein